MITAALAESDTVLLAGAGGGYDILAGLALYFALKDAGKTVYLSNLSFADLAASNARRIDGTLFEVTADSTSPQTYFPELFLARYLNRVRDDASPVYAIERSGVLPTVAAYQSLNDHLGGVDAIVLIDGGTDILMRGDEAGLGTRQEDMASLIAAHQVRGPRRKLVACVGFGVDAFHGVCHAQFLEAVAALTCDDAFLGAWTLTKAMPEVAFYLDAIDYIGRINGGESIVNASIASAIRGEFGDVHSSGRTVGGTLFINPLMSLV